MKEAYKAYEMQIDMTTSGMHDGFAFRSTERTQSFDTKSSQAEEKQSTDPS